jgi:predicted RNase H-like HicB family nuclease
MKHEFTVVYEKSDDGWWVASALELAGAFSQGKTIDEAREMLSDAIKELLLANREIAERDLSDNGVIREQLAVEI